MSNPEPQRQALRPLAWACLLLVWATLTTVHFLAAGQRVAEKGNPLQHADLNIAQKTMLLHQVRALQDSGALRALRPEEPLLAAVSSFPDDVLLRCRTALMLASAGQVQEARQLLTSQAASSALQAPVPWREEAPAAERARACEAATRQLLEAEALSTAAKSVPSHTLESTRAPLEHVAGDSWVKLWVELRLAQLAPSSAHRGPSAQALQAQLEHEATVVLVGFFLLGCGLLGELGLGLLVILLLITRGRDMDLNARPSDSEVTWSSLEGCGTVVLWMVVSLALHTAAELLGLRGTQSVLAIQGLLYGTMLTWMHRLAGGRWKRLGVHSTHWVRSALVGAAGLPLNLVLVGLAAVLLQRLRGHSAPSTNPIFQMMHDHPPVWVLLALGLVVAVVGPLFEELLFRGVLFGSLRSRLGSSWGALASGIIFGLAHADLNSLVPLSLMGTLLALLYARTGSIWTSFATHLLWNGQVFVATLFLFS